MTINRKETFLVTIQTDIPMTARELQVKFKHWVEHNCHTTSSFGFEIEELDNPGKRYPHANL